MIANILFLACATFCAGLFATIAGYTEKESLCKYFGIVLLVLGIYLFMNGYVVDVTTEIYSASDIVSLRYYDVTLIDGTVADRGVMPLFFKDIENNPSFVVTTTKTLLGSDLIEITHIIK